MEGKVAPAPVARCGREGTEVGRQEVREGSDPLMDSKVPTTTETQVSQVGEAFAGSCRREQSEELNFRHSSAGCPSLNQHLNHCLLTPIPVFKSFTNLKLCNKFLPLILNVESRKQNAVE